MSRVRDALRWTVWGARVLVGGARELARLVRGGGLKEAIEPWRSYPRVEDIPYEDLAADGVRAVLFDLENTLIPSGGPFTAEARAVVDRVRSAGMGVGVVSNASAAWVRVELEREGVAHVAPAGKPSAAAFVRGCALVGASPEDVVYVGDQVITDVLGSQRAGLRAILVEQRYPYENLSARFQRVITRSVVRRSRLASSDP